VDAQFRRGQFPVSGDDGRQAESDPIATALFEKYKQEQRFTRSGTICRRALASTSFFAELRKFLAVF